mgnify:FL=1
MLRTTITLTRYREPDELLFATLRGLTIQKDVDADVLFLDQNPGAAAEAFCHELDSGHIRFDYRRAQLRGISHARNLAIENCTTPTLLFIDADAIAEPDWASNLVRTLLPDGTGVAGGRILPEWHKRPLLMARAHIVYEQYSMLDHGNDLIPVSRVVGASFGINIEHLGREARFDEDLGRQNGILLGGEESELCARAVEAGLGVMYQGKAVVRHQVLPERIRYSWIFRRLYYAGVTRALRGGAPSPAHRMTAWDYVFMPLVLIPYALGYRKGISMRGKQ